MFQLRITSPVTKPVRERHTLMRQDASNRVIRKVVLTLPGGPVTRPALGNASPNAIYAPFPLPVAPIEFPTQLVSGFFFLSLLHTHLFCMRRSKIGASPAGAGLEVIRQ